MPAVRPATLADVPAAAAALAAAFESYRSRERRFGRTSEQVQAVQGA